MDFKNKIVGLLVAETGLSVSDIAALLSVPPNPNMGDYAFPCFKLGRNPKQKAEELQQRLGKKLPSFLTKVQALGPYINFFIAKGILAEEVLSAIATCKEKYGRIKGTKETVIVEFFHANTHKGVHIGHIRNISLGSALCNLLEATGRKVIRVNYQGDIGPHVAKCLWGYVHFKEKEPKDHRGIWLGKIYAKASQKIKEKPELEDEVKELNTKIYQHDRSVELLWKKTRQWCLDDFNYFYKEFGVQFDRLYFESEVAELGKKVLFDLLKKGIAAESDGAIILDLKEYGLDVYVGLTSQGNPTYQGKELGLAQLKQKEFKFDKSIHVVGAEQNLFFQQVFKTYELMKSPLAGKSTHVSYGLVMLPEGKMSSREGTMVLYHDLFQEMLALSVKEIKKRHAGLSSTEVEKRAGMISFGALKYSMISRENQKNTIFDREKALDFEGDTGPYIQYAHARCASILRKASGRIMSKVHFESLNTEHERKLILHLSRYSGVVGLAAEQYRPYLVAGYLLELAQLFNEFYHNCPVISELQEVMRARLLLVSCVKQVLANGLDLLGIAAPEEM